MRIYLLIFLAILIASQSESIIRIPFLKELKNFARKRALDDKLKSFLDGLKDIMKKGSESLKVPVLDPFKSDPIALSVKTPDLVGDLTLASINIDGLSNYDVNRASFSIVGFKMGFSLEWPKIEGSVLNYNISNGRLMNFANFFGSGSAMFSIENLKFSIDLSLAVNQTTKFLFLKDVKTDISIGDNEEDNGVEFYTDGLYNDRELSELFSAVLSELAPAAVKDEDVKNTLNKSITDAGNKFLNGKSMKDLLDLMKPKSKI